MGLDAFSEPTFSPAITVQCAVVSLSALSQKTSVRTDSSASRGAADEFVATSKILFPITARVFAGDRVEVEGVSLVVTGVEPRRAVTGRLDHNEVDLELWIDT